jgi:hypothetical protein
MSGSKHASLLVCWCFTAIAWSIIASPATASQDDEPLTGLASDEPGLFDPPPGDPWYSPPQQAQARPPRSGAGDALVAKTRITPHWFNQNNRFWYRNDLPGGKREFILVDTEDGTREPAFDHQKLAAALATASGIASISAEKLPFDSIEFDQEKNSLRFRVGETTWQTNLASYACARSDKPLSTAGPEQPPANGRGRAGSRDEEADADDQPGPSDRSPDKKWTAFIKDSNVYVKRDGEPAEIKLSDDGKSGLSYGRLQWAPDSKTLVAFRIEPGDRKEVYLVQSSPPGGGRARLRSRAYPLPGDKFKSYELTLFDIESKKVKKPKVDQIDFESPRLRWRKDGRHFTLVPHRRRAQPDR